ncbi:MAG: tryptophan--tRNA ligase [Candidatus Aenigmarchaeota archaeon]|nr:tryptophan--tRNA ligase [Candidatus Aenigmarchaeota archaeon]
MENVLNPWEVKGEIDYEQLMKQFGIAGMDEYIGKIPDHILFRRGIVYGQRDFSRIADAIANKKQFIMMTGLMPSGKFHFGHKLVADQILYYQSLGAKIYLCVADLEAYNTRLGDLEELKKIAIEEYLVNYIALGLKPKNLDFYFQSNRSKDSEKSNKYYKLAAMAARHITFNEIQAIYGDLSPGKITSALIQVSDMLHPQLIEGPVPTIVPVGFDQDPHIRLARDISQRMTTGPSEDSVKISSDRLQIPESSNDSAKLSFIQLSSTCHKFIPGLKGGKMSSSDPYSYVSLTDSVEEANDKIMKHAFSGGRNSLEEHRRLGGNPEIDVCFQWLYAFVEPKDKKIKKIEEDYKSGKLLTGELKQYTVELLTKFLEKHQKAREAAKSKIGRFLKN